MAFTKMASRFKSGSPFKPSLRDFGDFSYKLFMIATWVPVIIFFNQHVAEVTTIDGKSMYPYLNTGYDESLKDDVVLVNKMNPLDNLQRGMVVTFWSPERPEVSVVKRVIALEGDKVVTRAPYSVPIAQIPAGHVWVEGDNRSTAKSNDSNYYGPISMNLITGRVTHILYPWNSFGRVKWWEFKGKTKVYKANGKYSS